MKTAVIYARYSSERQTEQSIEGQLTVCNRYAEQNDITIVGQYIDRAMTGTNDNRADFQRMLKDSYKKAWDIVLVYKLDRFSRNKYETAIHKKTLRDNGIKLVSATENIPDTPEGIILESLLEGMAEYYSVELAQKIRRGQEESRKKGNYSGGGIPYGYRAEGTRQSGKKLIIQEDEAEIIRYIFNEFIAGRQIQDIYQEFLEKGVLCKGKPFARSTVYSFLTNEKYAGIYRHNGIVYENTYPAIISTDLFDMVKSRLDFNRYGKHKEGVIYLLRNKIKCGYCGERVNSDSGTARSGVTMRYYKCRNRRTQHCEQMPVRKELLEKLVIETTLEALNSSSAIEKVATLILAANAKRIADTSVMNILTRQIAELQKSIDNVLNAIEQGIVTNSTKERLEKLEYEKSELEVKLAAEKSRGKLQLQKSDIVRCLKAGIKKDPLPMITLLVKQVILYNDKIEIYYNYTDTKRPDDDHQAFLFCTTSREVTVDVCKFGCSPTAINYTIEAYF